MARVHSSTTLAETLSWYSSLFLVVMLVLSCCECESVTHESERIVKRAQTNVTDHRPCDEIYVVREGETLHTIGEKCGDPYIVEENPHIHDPDDVFPGLVLKITPFKNR